MAQLHEHKDCHVHVRCPECGGTAFEVMIYEAEVIIKCYVDGEAVELSQDLIDDFIVNLHKN